MKKLNTTIVLPLLLSSGLLFSSVAQATHHYEINLKNTNNESKKILVKEIKLKIKKGFDWKSWRTVHSGVLSITNGQEIEKKENKPIGYKHKWKFDWKCEGNDNYMTYEGRKTGADNDGTSNAYFNFTSCNSNPKAGYDGNWSDTSL